MPGIMTSYAISPDIEASCAICGAPPYPECPHEGDRLKLALEQALARWQGVQNIREWVLIHARNTIISTFQTLKNARFAAHTAYLQTLPCYTLFIQYHGAPPLQPQQLHMLHSQIQHANGIYKQGVDEDWRRSCLRYPEVLDYFFSLVEISWPEDRDPSVREPRFGASPVQGVPKRVKGTRRGSVGEESESRSGKREREKERGHRRKDSGRTPPPGDGRERRR